MKDTSDSRIAIAASMVALSRPVSCPSATSSSTPASTIGLRPAANYLHLGPIQVNPDDRVAEMREPRRGYRSDTPQSKHAD
jgi:hypothetical protein